MIEFLETLLSVKDELPRLRGDFVELRKIVDSPVDMGLVQYLQLYLVARAFAPDMVVELGRSHGNSTSLFLMLANQAGGLRRIVSYDLNDRWSRTEERLRLLYGERWLAPADIRTGDVKRIDYASVYGDAARVLVFWDVHAIDQGRMIGDREFNDFLARGLPPLVGRQHLVVVDDMLDMRGLTLGPEYVAADGLPTFFMGPLWSQWPEVVPLLDFLTRNRIRLRSPSQAIAGWMQENGDRPDRIGEFSAAFEAAEWSLDGLKKEPVAFIYFDLADRPDDAGELALPGEWRIEVGQPRLA